MAPWGWADTEIKFNNRARHEMEILIFAIAQGFYSLSFKAASSKLNSELAFFFILRCL